MNRRQITLFCQAAFDQFMQDYTRTYSWGIATTAGFEQLAERDCNCNLTQVFNEWVHPNPK